MNIRPFVDIGGATQKAVIIIRYFAAKGCVITVAVDVRHIAAVDGGLGGITVALDVRHFSGECGVITVAVDV